MRGRKRRLLSSTFKERRSARLAAKEPGAVDKAAKLNLSGVSRSLADAIEESGILRSPAPSVIPVSKVQAAQDGVLLHCPSQARGAGRGARPPCLIR